jgi:hypothetical protein
MSIEGIIIGLLTIVIGLAWMTYGLKAFVILLPVWGFLIGLLIGAQWVQHFLGDGFLATVTSWVVGLVVGIVFALISYFWYWGAVVLLGASVGYTLGSGLLQAVGIDNFLSIILGLIVGALVAGLVIILNVPATLVIVLTALGGAASVVDGVWLFLGQIQLADFDWGLLEGPIRGGIVTTIAWVVLAVLGMAYQQRDLARTAAAYGAAIDRSAYRIQ